MPIAEAGVMTARLRPDPILSVGGDHLPLLNTRFTEVNATGPSEYNARTDFLLERGGQRLTWIIPITVVIIFGLLYWTIDSALDGVLVLATVPFSIVGGVVALYPRGIAFSVSAAVGCVSLFGVAVMSGVLYIAEINRRRRTQPTA